MTKTELTDYLFSNNPHWRDSGVKLTPKGIESLIKTVYNEGYKEGYRVGDNKIQDDPYDLLNSIFTKGKK